MAASYKTIEVVRRHVSDNQIEKIVSDLLLVDGNVSFREIIRRLAAVDARVG